MMSKDLLTVTVGEGICDNCEKVTRLIILDGYNGGVGICQECHFRVLKKMNECAVHLNKNCAI
ncbi:MAG: hypothetical protein BLM47_13730 [Candidatus Reconcilbacillus cellulovorans]|uniref:Uncharacterized protein n=1 Tax=Candidatus Reconcilbacillus cellulovorans TaxID=1906605 RepID=A0A2A6DWF7_9BACL|nr:MAG: hypothetical protein BLM47_13730 [Candidatus Reconcilbacillus cellulovorans]